MVIKLIGLSVAGYLADPFNVFDGVVVLFGVLEMVVAVVTATPLIPDECSRGVNLSVLRALRLVKILFAIPRPSLRELLGTMSRAVFATSALALPRM